VNARPDRSPHGGADGLRDGSAALLRAALCTALMAALSQIAVPMPTGVPVTLQTFAFALAGYCQRPRFALLSAAAYLLLGLAGAPVYAGFGAGVGTLAGPTGGFLVGFVPMCALFALAAARPGRLRCVLLSLSAIAACHALGTAWFCVVGHMGPGAAFLAVSAPYLIKDAASAAGAWLLCRALRRARVIR
jgi:biotin transport system substrate-specific component